MTASRLKSGVQIRDRLDKPIYIDLSGKECGKDARLWTYELVSMDFRERKEAGPYIRMRVNCK